MKVQNNDGIPKDLATTTHAAKSKKVAKAYKQPPAEASTGVGTDRLEVSDRARALQTAADALRQLPDIRTDKVEHLKAQIKAGTYQVSGEQIAERILKDDTLA
ncbi:MAG TPA: flagellar biosynthesis anti-sigma factor FlgM [Candidatus Methylomirabilis sp.]|nr:flagellar biosynthesis anti-sigma factor FlgM [Candidatus Methylomirabilis sp.]